MSTENAAAENTPVAMPPVSAPKVDTTKEQLIAQGQMEVSKSSTASLTLPCGFLAPDGSLLTDVVVREIKGRDEDMLASKKTISQRKMVELITQCIDRLGPYTERGQIAQAVPRMLTGDGVFLFVAIRRVTVGDEYAFNDACPNCEKTSLFKINLADLSTKPMPDAKKRSYTVTTPRGLTVVFHPQTLADEARVAEERTDDTQVTWMMLGRIDSINGKAPTVEFLQDMGGSEREFLRDQFNEVEGGVDTSIELACPKCAHEYEKELDISQGFFFRSVTQKRSKTRSST